MVKKAILVALIAVAFFGMAKLAKSANNLNDVQPDSKFICGEKWVFSDSFNNIYGANCVKKDTGEKFILLYSSHGGISLTKDRTY